MPKPKGASLLDELKKLPQRTYAKGWPEKLAPAALAEFTAIQQAVRAGDIVCSGKVIADKFFARFPQAPRISEGHFSKILREG